MWDSTCNLISCVGMAYEAFASLTLYRVLCSQLDIRTKTLSKRSWLTEKDAPPCFFVSFSSSFWVMVVVFNILLFFYFRWLSSREWLRPVDCVIETWQQSLQLQLAKWYMSHPLDVAKTTISLFFLVNCFLLSTCSCAIYLSEFWNPTLLE